MRKKKMVMVSHCLINVNSKVEGFNPFEAMLKELIDLLHKKGYGIIQLPCPELILMGMRRWGVVKEQLSHPHAIEVMNGLLRPIIQQLEAYRDAGYEVPFVIGVDGSPSCGVSITCKSQSWRGELSSLDDPKKLLGDLTVAEEMGIFMELLQKELTKKGLPVEFLAVDEENIAESMDRIRASLEG